ncbi:MAG: SagB/ThcOx family dehydrogenase [Candidatus Orphnella occulta]|nr:SagB/ThcOx family dehydrogenase [Candidatus Orphnella occulta]
MKIFLIVTAICLTAINVCAETDIAQKPGSSEAIKLLEAQTDGGKPLMQALKDRRSSRTFSDKEISDQILSNLLWAGFGINRPDSELRTAPSARNMQEIDIYVAMKKGLYIYEPKQHVLKLVLREDIRAITGKQDFVAVAPLNLIYVADYSRMDKTSTDKEFYSAADTGFISQNVYLYCASENLATVIRGWVDKEALAKAMNLDPEQRIILAQTVGYEK